MESSTTVVATLSLSESRLVARMAGEDTLSAA